MLSPAKRSAKRITRRVMQRIATQTSSAGEFSYVFVVTYARSGSTLLTGLLNAIPGYRIRGENYSVLYRLYQADAALNKAADKYTEAFHLQPSSAWYGTPRTRPDRFRAALVDNFVANVLRPEPGDRVLGFKEIRYTTVHMTDLAEFLEFLLRAFPNSKIVFNHRDPVATAKSAWWARNPNAEQLIRAADDRLLAIASDDRHFHFCYDEIDDSLVNVRNLYAFLGEHFDEPAVRAALGTVHSTVTQHS